LPPHPYKNAFSPTGVGSGVEVGVGEREKDGLGVGEFVVAGVTEGVGEFVVAGVTEGVGVGVEVNWGLEYIITLRIFFHFLP
jgi:hypothetical protein